MKVLRIIPSMNPKNGGPIQGIRNSIPALAELGVENEVVCLDDPNDVFLARDPFKIHALGGKNYPGAYNSRLAKWLTAHIHQYDALLIHGLWLYHSYIAIKTVNKLRRKGEIAHLKVYVMPHGMLDPWFQRDKSRKIKALRNEIYWRLIERNVVNSADALFFTCEQELLLAKDTFAGYNPRKEINVGYGIQDPPAFRPEMERAFQNLAPLKGIPYLLFLSRIHPKKGVDLLIEAYIELYRSGKNMPDLVISGPVETDYGRQMIQLAQGNNQIHFTGMLEGDAKWGAFYGCEAFILPSHQENFGIAVVEALACGKPVLISDQVNIWREIMEENGGLVASDSFSGTHKLLSEFDKAKKAEMGINARKVYEQKFTISSAAKKMAKILYG